MFQKKKYGYLFGISMVEITLHDRLLQYKGSAQKKAKY